MSKTIDKSDLTQLSDEDLKYLHDRGEITDEELANAVNVDEYELRDAITKEGGKPTPLDQVAHTGDANTAGHTPESHQRMVGRMVREQKMLTETDDGEAMPDDYNDALWTNDKLREEIVRRNEGRAEEDQLSLDGKKRDLIATLEADDEE